jgi:hypothetical protein
MISAIGISVMSRSSEGQAPQSFPYAEKNDHIPSPMRQDGFSGLTLVDGPLRVGPPGVPLAGGVAMHSYITG